MKYMNEIRKTRTLNCDIPSKMNAINTPIENRIQSVAHTRKTCQYRKYDTQSLEWQTMSRYSGEEVIKLCAIRVVHFSEEFVVCQIPYRRFSGHRMRDCVCVSAHKQRRIHWDVSAYCRDTGKNIHTS